MLCKAIYSMEIQLNRIRAECWQIARGHVVFMFNEVQFWVLQIQPRRHLAACYEMDSPYPRGIFFYGSKPKPEQPPVPITLPGDIIALIF